MDTLRDDGRLFKKALDNAGYVDANKLQRDYFADEF